MNTLDEVSDYHAIRFTGNVLCPFKKSVWNGIWVKAGNYSGDTADLSLIRLASKGIGATQRT